MADTTTDWRELAQRTLAGGRITRAEALAVLHSGDDELLEVLAAAFEIRRRHFGRTVNLHVIQNAKSGLCTEDCAFCSQSAVAESGIAQYALQSADEIAEGARWAKARGALRYCIVASGRGPADAEVDRLCDTVRRIKGETDIQICTSLGLLTPDQARRLAAAGVDRYNHNLETSERHYPAICATHSWQDRVRTIGTAREAGLEICCGGLIGMGESDEDRADLALSLRNLGADSIPVNLLDPRAGTPLEGRLRLTPRDGLRVLAMFRFVNPATEIRIAGGREAVLGHLQPLALYPANSIFTEGYLTTPGQGWQRDMDLLRDAGFEVGHWVSA